MFSGWCRIFDCFVILPSILSFLLNIYVIYFQFKSLHYFFAGLGLFFIIATQLCYLIASKKEISKWNKDNYWLIGIITCPVAPLIIYVIRSNNATNKTSYLTERTPLTYNAFNNYSSLPGSEIKIKHWQTSKRSTLSLFLLQAIIETFPCVLLQILSLFIDSTFQQNMISISIAIGIISFIIKSSIFCSEIIALFYIFRWMCIIIDILWIFILLSCTTLIFNPHYPYTLTPIGYLISFKIILLTFPFIISLHIKNYKDLVIEPPFQFVISSMYTHSKICYYILKIPLLIIDIIFTIIYQSGILIVSLLIFELCNFQLLYYLSLSYFHGRFLGNSSKLHKRVPFNVVSHSPMNTYKLITSNIMSTQFIFNPSPNNLSLFSPRYINSSHSSIPNQLFFQILFQWIFEYKTKSDLLYRILSTNYILIKYCKSKYNVNKVIEWLWIKHKYDICCDNPTINSNDIKQYILGQSKHKITAWYQIKRDLFGHKSQTKKLISEYISVYFKGIFAFIILPLYMVGRIMNIIGIPLLLMFAIWFPSTNYNNKNGVLSTNTFEILNTLSWDNIVHNFGIYDYFHLDRMINMNQHIQLVNMQILQWNFFVLYWIFMLIMSFVLYKVMYYEWILSCCIPGIIMDYNKYQTVSIRGKQREYVILRSNEFQESMFNKIVTFYDHIIHLTAIRNELINYMPDYITFVIISFLFKKYDPS